VNERALITKFWTHEAKTTRNVLARIPEASDYRPDPKSRTAREIAWQIVCEEQMIIVGIDECADRDDGVASRPVLDHHRLPPPGAQPIGQQARADIDA